MTPSSPIFRQALQKGGGRKGRREAGGGSRREDEGKVRSRY